MILSISEPILKLLCFSLNKCNSPWHFDDILLLIGTHQSLVYVFEFHTRASLANLA